MTMEKKMANALQLVFFEPFCKLFLKIKSLGIPLHYFQFLHIAESVLRNVSQGIIR